MSQAPGPGTRLGGYDIVGPLGSGGMGDVYRARDTRLAREVAIKVWGSAVKVILNWSEELKQRVPTR